jgi:hypothetical protein
MSFCRWLGVLGCLCLLAIPAQAQPTLQNFGVYPPNPTSPTSTSYTEYADGGSPGYQVVGGPPGGANATFYRLTTSGIGSTNANIAFDQTDPNNVTEATIDVDFSIGGTVGANNYADGLGVALIPVSAYGTTGNGPSITEEGDNAQDGAISFGLDIYNNGAPYDPDGNHLSVHYADPNTELVYAVSLTPFNYQLHQDVQSPLFDHATFTVNIQPTGGATVSVTITSNQTGNTGDAGGQEGGPPNGTTIPVGTSFQPVTNFFIPNVMPYQMRLGFGARTGGASDNIDITNVVANFTP